MIDQIWHFKNLQKLLKRKIKVFNYGKHKETLHTDDIVEDYQVLDNGITKSVG